MGTSYIPPVKQFFYVHNFNWLWMYPDFWQHSTCAFQNLSSADSPA